VENEPPFRINEATDLIGWAAGEGEYELDADCAPGEGHSGR
jgi:hypothetical protein